MTLSGKIVGGEYHRDGTTSITILVEGKPPVQMSSEAVLTIGAPSEEPCPGARCEKCGGTVMPTFSADRAPACFDCHAPAGQGAK